MRVFFSYSFLSPPPSWEIGAIPKKRIHQTLLHSLPSWLQVRATAQSIMLVAHTHSFLSFIALMGNVSVTKMWLHVICNT